MSYTVLARRYRSQEFDEVIGQEPVARTLSKAIETNRVAHAYLFCGTRGVGKTSMARIFAKALNVTDDLTDRDAIEAAIMRGDDIDVIEIDGASNRSVSEARDLISKSIYRPARSPYKIYIIDEVHMLTPEAFNTLLKTMEEPPEHVKFILATTEPHKVPATIQSRCQRFDFRNISASAIAGHLKNVLKGEKIKAENAVILQIARMANGSMRDSLSLLDRLLASGDKKLTLELLQETLGLPDQALIDSIIEAMAATDPGEALSRVQELINRGNSLDQVMEVMIERLRDLMIVSTCGAKAKVAIDLSDEDIGAARELANQFDLPGLVHMIVVLENTQRITKMSSTGRALFDAVVVRLTLAEKYADAAALLETAGNAPRAMASNEKKKPQPPVVSKPRPQIAPVSSPKPIKKKTPITTPSVAAPYSTSPTVANDSNAIIQCDAATLEHQLQERAQTIPAIDALLDHLSMKTVEGNRVVLILDDPAQAVQTRNSLALMTTVLADITNCPTLRVELIVEGASPRNGQTNQAHAPLTAEDRDAASKIPIVRQAIEILEMRVVNIEKQNADSS